MPGTVDGEVERQTRNERREEHDLNTKTGRASADVDRTSAARRRADRSTLAISVAQRDPESCSATQRDRASRPRTTRWSRAPARASRRATSSGAPRSNARTAAAKWPKLSLRAGRSRETQRLRQGRPRSQAARVICSTATVSRARSSRRRAARVRATRDGAARPTRPRGSAPREPATTRPQTSASARRHSQATMDLVQPASRRTLRSGCVAESPSSADDTERDEHQTHHSERRSDRACEHKTHESRSLRRPGRCRIDVSPDRHTTTGPASSSAAISRTRRAAVFASSYMHDDIKCARYETRDRCRCDVP